MRGSALVIRWSEKEDKNGHARNIAPFDLVHGDQLRDLVRLVRSVHICSRLALSNAHALVQAVARGF